MRRCLIQMCWALAVLYLLASLTGCGGIHLSSIAGTVTNADTGLPINGAHVTVGSKSTTTGTGGYYIITGLGSGTYTMTVTKDGYQTKTLSVDVTFPASDVNVELEPL